MQSRDDFQAKHVHKQAGMDHTIVMGTLPSGPLPGRVKPGRMLLEVWEGSAPAPPVVGPSATFDVEGTIVGDGRRWTGVRYTALGRDEDVQLAAATATHQVLVLAPTIDRWA
jgi:hypothetical protein